MDKGYLKSILEDEIILLYKKYTYFKDIDCLRLGTLYDGLTEDEILKVIEGIGKKGIQFDEDVEYEDGLKTVNRYIRINE